MIPAQNSMLDVVTRRDHACMLEQNRLLIAAGMGLHPRGPLQRSCYAIPHLHATFTPRVILIIHTIAQCDSHMI